MKVWDIFMTLILIAKTLLTGCHLVSGPRTPKPMLLAALNTVKDFVMGRLGDMEVNGADTAVSDVAVSLDDGNFEDLVLKSDSLWLVEFYSPR